MLNCCAGWVESLRRRSHADLHDKFLGSSHSLFLCQYNCPRWNVGSAGHWCWGRLRNWKLRGNTEDDANSSERRIIHIGHCGGFRLQRCRCCSRLRFTIQHTARTNDCRILQHLSNHFRDDWNIRGLWCGCSRVIFSGLPKLPRVSICEFHEVSISVYSNA